VTENLQFIADTYGATPAPVPDDLRPYADVLVGDMPLSAQRQAAFIAALSRQPEALLLDEPTSGVDALSRASLWDTIRGQSNHGVGVLVTTHYMQEAQQCERLLLMSNGKLVAQGSEADIIGSTTAVSVQTDDWATTFAASTQPEPRSSWTDAQSGSPTVIPTSSDNSCAAPASTPGSNRFRRPSRSGCSCSPAAKYLREEGRRHKPCYETPGCRRRSRHIHGSAKEQLCLRRGNAQRS
jgi:ABC-type multidrug transport system ATPase subunit